MTSRLPTPRSLAPLCGVLLCLTGCRSVPVPPATDRVLGTVPALAVPHAAAPPVIDGALTDPAWTNAAVIPALLPPWKARGRQLTPPPTVVRVLWDEKMLYIGFDCTDDDVYCSGTYKHDDLLYQEDVCEVFLDGVGDGRQYVEVQVSPAGTNLDLMYLLTAEAVYTPEMRLTPELCRRDRWKFLEWDMPELRTAARRTGTGWSAELAIPAEAIMRRHGSATFHAGAIRANFMRYDWPLTGTPGKRDLLQQNWSPVVPGNPHNSPARMGRLTLIAPSEGTR